MKTTDRIYPRLSPAAAAAVVWALLPTDPEEADRVAATVARELRALPVLQFGDALLRLNAVSAAWGIAHWRLKAEHVAACAALALSESDAGLMGAAESVRAAEGRLLACDHALDDSAADGGFDAQIVRAAALTVRFEPLHPDAAVDAEFMAALRGVFGPLAATARV